MCFSIQATTRRTNQGTHPNQTEKLIQQILKELHLQNRTTKNLTYR